MTDIRAEVAGVGLFSDRPGAVHISSTSDDQGITIRWPDGVRAPADVRSLTPPPPNLPARNTILAGTGGRMLVTTEHVLSALAGLGIWRATIAATGPEVPMDDGSASAFVRALRAAGIGSTPTTPILLREPIVVEDGKGGRIEAYPRKSSGATFEYRLDYGVGAPIRAQAAAWEPGGASEFGYGPGTKVYRDYAMEIAPARTFCLQAEALAMRAMGLFKHVTPREMLVIGPDGPIENELRFADEPARHKLLDLIGDLVLCGGPLQADVVATRAGHALNHRMARAILESGGV